MSPRRILLGAAAAAFLVTALSASPAGAGNIIPRDMIASPNTGPVGTHVAISNAANSPCGGQEGDGPAEVLITVTKPDSTTAETSATPAESGDWSLVYFDTDQVGTYGVEATCAEQDSIKSTNATNFDYTDTSFVITAAEVPTTTPTTAAPTTSSTAAPAAAVAATAAFTG